MQMRPGGIAHYRAPYLGALCVQHPALARMTRAQKVGQLIQADIDSITPDDLAHYPLGSVLNGGNSSPHGDKLAPPGEWLALADRFYDRIGEITAREVRVTGLDWAFSPSAALARDARWGRTYESRRTPPWCAAVSPRWWPGCRARPAAPAVRSQSAALAPTATQARSAFDTEPRLKLRAAAAMRVRACPSGIGGFVSPIFAL